MIKYNDTPEGVRDMLKAESALDPAHIDAARYTPDPHVEGVWLAEFGNGSWAMAYLGGYRDPFGKVREDNDFEVEGY
jgi:hypothetical protein